MRKKKPRELEADLDMTTFINLMVVLLAFLLLTAVFTEVATLNVNLPAGGGGGAADEKPAMALEVMIYNDRLLVADRQSGPMKSLPSSAGTPDYKGLTSYLAEIKAQHPDISDVTILMEPKTPYDQLIRTMDAVRYKPKLVNGQVIHSALFPDVSIGDAPPAAGGA